MTSTKGNLSEICQCNQPARNIEIKQQVRQNEMPEEHVPNEGGR